MNLIGREVLPVLLRKRYLKASSGLPPSKVKGIGTCERERKLTMITDLLEALDDFLLWLILADFHSEILDIAHSKGKSLFFEVFLLIGYAFGIIRKDHSGCRRELGLYLLSQLLLLCFELY